MGLISPGLLLTHPFIQVTARDATGVHHFCVIAAMEAGVGDRLGGWHGPGRVLAFEPARLGAPADPKRRGPMNVSTLRKELERLEGEGSGAFRLYIMPATEVADRNHQPSAAGVVIIFAGCDYPVMSVSSDYGEPEDAGYVFLEFGESVRPGPVSDQLGRAADCGWNGMARCLSSLPSDGEGTA
jgi:hypothetical protein